MEAVITSHRWQCFYYPSPLDWFAPCGGFYWCCYGRLSAFSRCSEGAAFDAQHLTCSHGCPNLGVEKIPPPADQPRPFSPWASFSWLSLFLSRGKSHSSARGSSTFTRALRRWRTCLPLHPHRPAPRQFPSSPSHRNPQNHRPSPQNYPQIPHNHHRRPQRLRPDPRVLTICLYSNRPMAACTCCYS